MTSHKHHLVYWLLAVTVLLAFALADIAIVAVPAMLLTPLQVVVGAIAFGLVAVGALVTVWQLE